MQKSETRVTKTIRVTDLKSLRANLAQKFEQLENKEITNHEAANYARLGAVIVASVRVEIEAERMRGNDHVNISF